jgi:hypothetical protein
MSTTETIRAWSAASNAANASSDAAISSSDSQSPDTVDNNIRSIMVAARKQMDDIGGSLAAGGTANALTVTTGQVLESGQITDGLRILLKATADNTCDCGDVRAGHSDCRQHQAGRWLGPAVGSIKSGMYLDLVYNSVSAEWRCTNIAPLAAAGVGGLQFLTSGTVAAAATLDIVLTGYTAYRGLKIVLGGFLPVTDGARLLMRFSTDGGSSYDASGYNYGLIGVADTNSVLSEGSGSTTSIGITMTGGGAPDYGIGNGATEGYSGEIILLKQTSAALWSRAHHQGYYISSAATPAGVMLTGGGAREAAQDTDAVRFLFSAGNITSGDYSLYGLA